MTILSIRGAPVSSGQVQKTVRLRRSRVILIMRRKTSVVCIRVVPCVLSNVPAEARARLQRCSRLTSPMIRLLRGSCQHPSPLMSRGGLSLWLLQLAPSTPRPGLRRRVTKQPVIAGGSSRFAGIPPTFLLRSWAVEYSRPRKEDSPITAWTAPKSVPSEDKCWHRPDSSTVCTCGPIPFGPAALLRSPASGDGRDWPWPERASPTARSVAENRLSSAK